ncbi:MAG: serine hydrolase [Actinobacteria bacterium]|nr:serine hydrolase [Actinomycetota bacterium]
MVDAPPLPPPAIEQPAAQQVSYGLVTGRAARGTRFIAVLADGRVLVSKQLRGRRFSLKVGLPRGDLDLRVLTVARDGRRSSRVVRDVYGLPGTASPRFVRSRHDSALARDLRRLVTQYDGTAGFYVQSLTDGRGAAWNAKAHFPAASTLKLAIATAVLARHSGIPAPTSYVGGLLREMIIPSDDGAANALEVWLAGSTYAGSRQVNALMRSIGMTDSIMYGGYEVSASLSASIPVRVDEQPAFGIGKHTTARDMAMLWRVLWLASGGRGPLLEAQSGLTPADARHLLWLAAHVQDVPKLDRVVGEGAGVDVLHKAGWISQARHDTGLVFWRGGVFVAGVMTYRSWGIGLSSDVLAGRLAARSLKHFRR